MKSRRLRYLPGTLRPESMAINFLTGILNYTTGSTIERGDYAPTTAMLFFV